MLIALEGTIPMIFTSSSFLLFFALTLLLYYLFPAKGQRLILLTANYVFYMWMRPSYALLLLVGTAISYLAGRATQARFLGLHKAWTAAGILFMLGQLFVFKYADFFLSGISRLCGWDNAPALGLALPIGISFYSFAAAGYLFDVYREKLEAERSFLDLALFLSFFPSILSGPIPLARELLPQFKYRHSPDFSQMRRGLLRFIWGASKKLVTADSLLVIVDTAYGAPESFTGGQWLVAAIAYSIYIYLDFSSYTDMAAGAAWMLGFQLPENFNAPYCARTVQSFWRRWHISLTSWFREYLFFPLGGSRVAAWRVYLNILIVFAVSGLWHGAAMTFVLWGLLNGVYQIVGQITASARRALRARLRIREDAIWLAALQMLTVCALMTSAWVFFRAENLEQALFILKRILLIARDGFGSQPLSALGLSAHRSLVLIFSIIPCIMEDAQKARRCSFLQVEDRPYLYCLTLAALLVHITVFGAYGADFDQNEFVYFQF